MNDEEVAAGLAVTPSYRYAERVGPQLFVAGQVPRNGAGELIGGSDAGQQATACLTNLQTLLNVHGFALHDVRQLVVYAVGEHQNLLDAWAAVTDKFDGDVPPATLLGVARLGYVDQLVEIDATIVQASDS